MVTRIGQLLGALGETRILDDHAHQAQVAADESLRMAKERQAQGLATGKEVVDVVRELTLLRGRGGSQRKRNLLEVGDFCAIRGQPLGVCQGSNSAIFIGKFTMVSSPWLPAPNAATHPAVELVPILAGKVGVQGEGVP